MRRFEKTVQNKHGQKTCSCYSMNMGTLTYTEARDKLATVWDEVVSSREHVVIKRRGHPDVALLPADELSGLLETAYLLRSPANARRLLGALKRARAGKGQVMKIEELRKKSGIDATHR
jgi:antitoxin YefM